MTTAAASRLAVSPYARRLAGERGLPLETLRGSGPGGRILAADVMAFVPASAPAGEPSKVAPSAVEASIAAFATTIALGALHEVLGALANAGTALGVEDLILRAVDRAFGETADEPQIVKTDVALESGRRQVLFANAAGIPLAALHAARLAAQAGMGHDWREPATLSIRLLPSSDIRPVMMPLLPGRTMRLTVSGTAGDSAECLLSVDASIVDEVVATAWLAALKSSLENPLRLFM